MYENLPRCTDFHMDVLAWWREKKQFPLLQPIVRCQEVLVLQYTQCVVITLLAESSQYLARHSWIRCWGRHASSPQLIPGPAPNREKIPVAPIDEVDFKHPRYCSLYLEFKKKSNDCPGMILSLVGPQTQFICSHCIRSAILFTISCMPLKKCCD
jgi:hypothetical protein